MTQVPEYLLERSRARRAALGLGGDAPAPAAASESGGGGAPAPAASGPATATATAVAEAPTPVAAAPAAPAVPAAPLPEYVTDPGPKSGIPYWMMPIVLLLPLWAIMYMGAFGERATSHAAPTPAQLYVANCAVCHGAQGQGGVGPKLSGGEAKLTFPDEAAHIAWVENGSAAVKGQPYGDPSRAKVATSGGMPAFKGQLTDEQIKAVVMYERDNL